MYESIKSMSHQHINLLNSISQSLSFSVCLCLIHTQSHTHSCTWKIQLTLPLRGDCRLLFHENVQKKCWKDCILSIKTSASVHNKCFQAECIHHPTSRICHLFTHNDVTVNLEECQLFIFQQTMFSQGILSLLSLPNISKHFCLPFLRRIYRWKMRLSLLLSFSLFFPTFSINIPFPHHDAAHWVEVFVITNVFFLINDALNWSNLTLPSMDRLCCFCIRKRELSHNWCLCTDTYEKKLKT